MTRPPAAPVARSARNVWPHVGLALADRRSRSSRSAPATGRSSTPQRLSTAPDNPAVIAVAAPGAPRPDRRSRRTAGSPAASATPTARRSASTATTPISHVVGYASRQYGTAGPRARLQRRAHRPRRIGPVRRAAAASSTPSPTIAARPPTTLDLRLQRAAVDGLGDDHGRGRDARPARPARCSRSPRRPSTTRTAIAEPRHRATRGVRRAARRRRTSRSCRGRRWAATCRARCSRSSPRSPGSDPGAIDARRRRSRSSRRPRRTGLARRRLPDPRRPPPADRRHGARPRRRDRGQLQHLVRAGRARRPAATDLVDGRPSWASARRSRSTCRPRVSR